MLPVVDTFYAEPFGHGQVLEWVVDFAGTEVIGFWGLDHFVLTPPDLCDHVFVPLYRHIEREAANLFFLDHASALAEARSDGTP